jgi:hypothetical protein
MPGTIPRSARYCGTGVPSDIDCLIVSSYRITPPIHFSIPSVLNISSRKRRRVSAVDSMPSLSSRLLIVPVLSSAARIPLPPERIARAVDSSSRVDAVTGSPLS